jgi:hypothetical protein
MNLDEEKISAQENFKRLVNDMPSWLAKKEDKFAEKLILSKINPIRKLESLYGVMRELYDFSAKYTPCKKGCSACCHYNVTISEVEISFIEKYTRKKRNKQYIPHRNFHGSPCPFLVNGACTIYDVRPFVCRRHVALTKSNAWCQPSVSNDETFPLLNFTSIDQAYDQIRIESKSLALVDIREVFGEI